MTAEQANTLDELYSNYQAQKALYDKEKLLNGEWHYNYDHQIWYSPASLGSYHYTQGGSNLPDGMAGQIAYTDQKLAMFEARMIAAKKEYDDFQEDMRQIASNELELAQLNATPSTETITKLTEGSTVATDEAAAKKKKTIIIIVSVIGGVIILGTIIILIVRKSKKST